ncbi:phosphotransferase [Actinomadura barringtoniae]|uniref:Phosphotransferase n=1 Tax=Actinomadura barringtoniae TaxID=1427535 RepID=A0A939T2F5_9ACTN|nr:phosphotransferase [Actinomadura barringtoniae]MBO2449541.1 phosphotransferase [Actinomadura barringtoniae]
MYRWEGRRYVLSQVHKDDRRVPFHRQFALTGFLNEHTGVVKRAHPPIGRDETPWIEDASHYWFVRPYTDHDAAPDWCDPQLIEDFATKLAMVHSIAQKHDAPPAGELAPYHWPVRTVLTRPDEFVDDMDARLRPPDEVDHVRLGLKGLAEDAAGLDLGPVGITHQDLSPANILVKNREVVSIIDWDRAQVDRLLYDAVLAALHLTLRQPATDPSGAAERFIKTYRRTYDVDDAAVRWMFRYAVLRNLAVSRSPEKWRRLTAFIRG